MIRLSVLSGTERQEHGEGLNQDVRKINKLNKLLEPNQTTETLLKKFCF